MLPTGTDVIAVMIAKSGSLVVLTNADNTTGFNVYLTFPLETAAQGDTSELHQAFSKLTGVTRLYLPQQGSSIRAQAFEIDAKSLSVARTADYFAAHFSCKHLEFGFTNKVEFGQMFGSLNDSPALTLNTDLFEYALTDDGDLMVTFK